MVLAQEKRSPKVLNISKPNVRLLWSPRDPPNYSDPVGILQDRPLVFRAMCTSNLTVGYSNDSVNRSLLQKAQV